MTPYYLRNTMVIRSADGLTVHKYNKIEDAYEAANRLNAAYNRRTKGVGRDVLKGNTDKSNIVLNVMGLK